MSPNFCKGNIETLTWRGHYNIYFDSILPNRTISIEVNIYSDNKQELCTVKSARLVVAGVMMVAVVHMIPRMTDRQYFITSLGGN